MTALARNHAGMHDGGSSREDVAARLQLLRRWAGYTRQRPFAQMSDIPPDQWHLFEKGRRPLPLSAANKLRLRWQVDLDWLYHGDRSGLSVEVSRTLPSLVDFRKQA